nr:hypothetical protein AOJQRVMU_AOJQRVMU_CDS_0007 [Microvirus sp.]
MVNTLSGFGPSYAELMADPDACRSLYGCYVYVDTFYRRKRYLLKFCADYDLPGAVYLSDITDIASGEHWFASDCTRNAFMDTYPLDWAWV